MSTITLLTTLILCFALSMCSSSKEENMEPLSAAQQADTSEVPPMPSPPIPIAPGTAQITATIISTEETDSGMHCILKIEKVHKYGSSTPPLPSGTEIKALIAAQLVESDDTEQPMIAAENTVEITLRHMGMAKMAGSDSPDWQVSSIKR